MTIFNQNHKIFYILIFCFCNHLLSQEISAQKYFELIQNQNQFIDGYYEGNLEILQPYQKKQIYDFVFIKKNHNFFWEFRQFEQVHYRALCNQKIQVIYFYDKKRDVMYNKKEEQILKEWIFIPYFLFCGILLEPILDPQKIEKQEEIFIFSNFFYPNSSNSILVHVDSDLRLKKYILYFKKNQTNSITHRIFFFYDYPIRNIKNNFPSRIEIIQAIKNSVAIFQWNLYYDKYKVDDIRFMPEFLSR